MFCYAKSLQSCPTLCDPKDGSPPGSAIPGIPQARTVEWVAISFSNAWKWKVKGKSLSHVRLLATPWTAAYQTSPSMGFSRQEYWSGVPLPSPGYLHKLNVITRVLIRERQKVQSHKKSVLWHKQRVGDAMLLVLKMKDGAISQGMQASLPS